MASPSFPKLRGSDEQASRAQDNISQQLQPIAKALSATPIMGASAPSWIAPSLLNGFANTSGFAAAGFHRDALGYFHGKGVLTNAAGVAAGSTIYVAPSGYRPRETQRFSVRGAAGTVQAVTVTPAGLVSNDLVLAAGDTIDLAFSFLTEQ